MRNENGFSLLELLVALALLSVIGVGLAGAMRLGADTYSRAQSLEGHSAEISTRARLRRLLERAAPPTLLTPFPKDLSGSQSNLSFVSLAPMGFAKDAAGIKITIALENEQLIKILDTFDDNGAVLETFRAPLANDVEDVSISYFFADVWQETWNDQNALPELISISLDGGSEPIWPDFTVKLIYAN